VEGTPFGRYRLLTLLGRGGMGEVWRAYDTETSRIVAVKVLPAQLIDDDLFQERFRREARVAASLSDPHVVPIHHFGEIDGKLYVDMRLIEGRDLDSMLRGGRLDPIRAVTIIGQVASALDSAHRAGLVHRDVKPSNILVGDDDFAYLIDFGIARAAGEVGLTSTGTTIGTWAYMAPERFSTGHADPRSDIYALSCVLYQSLTGQQPFPGNTLEQQVAAHLVSPPPQPSAFVPGLARRFDSVIATGMAKDPAARYATTKDLAQAAHAALAETTSRPTSAAPASVHPEPPPMYAPPPPMYTPPPPPMYPAPFSHSASTQQRASGEPPHPSSPASNLPPGANLRQGRLAANRPWWQRKHIAIPVLGGSAVLVLIAAVIAVLTLSANHEAIPSAGSPSSTMSTSPSGTIGGRPTRSATTTPKPPNEGPGSFPTIASYIVENDIQETQVKRGDPGSPTIDLPVPEGWAPAGADTPEWAYSAIVYTGPEAAEYKPSIIALVSKLSGNAEPQKILDLAPGELKNLPGWKGPNEGDASTLSGFPAYQLGGTWTQDGQTKAIAQKTVVMARSDGLYVLQLNVDGLENQMEILDAATAAIDERTTITF
jgi:serine/threonine protein kinase